MKVFWESQDITTPRHSGLIAVRLMGIYSQLEVMTKISRFMIVESQDLSEPLRIFIKVIIIWIIH